ncbi:MAG: hypothetical protein ABF291_02420, partial [Desulfobacterales bacterium]
GVGRADVLLYFKCPTTKQMRCPVNAYGAFKCPIHKYGFFSLGKATSRRNGICGEAYFMYAAAGNPRIILLWLDPAEKRLFMDGH